MSVVSEGSLPPDPLFRPHAPGAVVRLLNDNESAPQWDGKSEGLTLNNRVRINSQREMVTDNDHLSEVQFALI